jgi:hypothetical protein
MNGGIYPPMKYTQYGIENDIGYAAYAFQERHGSKGKLVMFVTENGGIEWKKLN